MRLWITASVSFFAYIALCALVRPGGRARSRSITVVGAAGGVALCAAAHVEPIAPVLHDWILPPVVLLIAYRLSALLFVAPMPRLEAVLASVDRSLQIDRLAATLPTWTAELLEAAYLAISPLV